MSYTFIPDVAAHHPSQQLPLHLDHKPVFAVPYQAFDGFHPGNSDVQFVSVGLAQYDPDEISVKTMRYTGTKWTRQAEELPLHRPIDMTLFLAKVIFDNPSGIISIPPGTMENQTSTVEVRMEQLNVGETASYTNAVQQCQPLLKSRLNALRDVLNDLKSKGEI